MIRTRIKQMVSHLVPSNLKPLAKRVYYRGRHPYHPALKRFGTVQDLYYWVVDGNVDTELLLQNYFSPFFPALDTATTGTVSLFDPNGVSLGNEPFAVEHNGCARLRVSELLADFQDVSHNDFGSLEVNITIPEDVLDRIQEQHAMYFWDRFYIGYSNKQGQICFVHGVDRAHIYHQGNSKPINWSEIAENFQWAPEIPVDIDDYQRFSVILLNRTARFTEVKLILSDSKDETLEWTAQVPPKGVHRFVLTQEKTQSLEPSALRMRVEGMPTQFGRPMVFKEFRNGAISAMHC